MDKDLENFIVLGRFGRPHGIKGFISIHSFTEPRENILNYKSWHFYYERRWQPLIILQKEMNHKHLLVQVKGFEGRDNIGKLTNIEIAVPKEELPEPDEGDYYWHQLIGLSVFNQHGEPLGIITEILPTGSNDVLIVEAEVCAEVKVESSEKNKCHAKANEPETKEPYKRQILIPYLPGDTIVNIDLQQQKMLVAWDWDY